MMLLEATYSDNNAEDVEESVSPVLLEQPSGERPGTIVQAMPRQQLSPRLQTGTGSRPNPLLQASPSRQSARAAKAPPKASSSWGSATSVASTQDTSASSDLSPHIRRGRPRSQPQSTASSPMARPNPLLGGARSPQPSAERSPQTKLPPVPSNWDEYQLPAFGRAEDHAGRANVNCSEPATSQEAPTPTRRSHSSRRGSGRRTGAAPSATPIATEQEAAESAFVSPAAFLQSLVSSQFQEQEPAPEVVETRPARHSQARQARASRRRRSSSGGAALQPPTRRASRAVDLGVQDPTAPLESATKAQVLGRRSSSLIAPWDETESDVPTTVPTAVPPQVLSAAAPQPPTTTLAAPQPAQRREEETFSGHVAEEPPVMKIKKQWSVPHELLAVPEACFREEDKEEDEEERSCSRSKSPKYRAVEHEKPLKASFESFSLPGVDCRSASVRLVHASAPEPRAVKVCDSSFDMAQTSLAKMGGIEGGSAKSWTVGKNLASAAQASSPPPLVVHLPRVGNLRSPMVGQQAIHCGTVPEHFTPLCLELHAQRALGQGLRVDASALLHWYAPYLALAAVLLMAGLLPVLFGSTAETIPIVLVIALFFPSLHMVRLARCKRLLHMTVDSGSLVEVNWQLHAPLSRLALAGQGMFTATLSNALESLRQPPLLMLNLIAVFTGPSARSCLLCSFLWCVLQGIVRAMRPLWNSVWPDVLLMVIGTSVLIVFGCSPREQRSREDEVDERLATLEAAFNAMLDTLRPLLCDVQEPPPVQPMTKGSSQPFSAGLSAAALHRHAAAQAPTVGCGAWRPTANDGDDCGTGRTFSVRLLTAERQTLRAELHFATDIMGDKTPWTRLGGQKSALHIQCHLANVGFEIDKVVSSSTTTLGHSAAALVDAVQSSPVLGVGPMAGIWSLDAQNAGRSGQVGWRRQEDEVSCSLASISTASTLRTGRGNQPDEVCLQRGMSMVRSLASRRSCPLEIFSAASASFKSRPLIPPKAAIDEWALLLEVQANGSVQHEPKLRSWASLPLQWWQRRMGCRHEVYAQPLCGDQDTFGVLYSSADVCRLRRTGEGNVSLASSSRAVAPAGLDSPRSTGSSACSEAPIDVLSSAYLTPGMGGSRGMRRDRIVSKHLVILFDTAKERAMCQKFLRQAKISSDDLIPSSDMAV